MTKKQLIEWVKNNYTFREILDEVAKGTLIWARLLIKYKVKMEELL